MYLRHSIDGAGGENILFSVPEISDFRASARTLGGIAEYSPMAFTLLGDQDAVRSARRNLADAGQGGEARLGLLIGIAGALVLARLMRGLLFGVGPYDPITLASVAVLMAAIGVAACWIPAARAARIDPGVALRAQ